MNTDLESEAYNNIKMIIHYEWLGSGKSLLYYTVDLMHKRWQRKQIPKIFTLEESSDCLFTLKTFI